MLKRHCIEEELGLHNISITKDSFQKIGIDGILMNVTVFFIPQKSIKYLSYTLIKIFVLKQINKELGNV